MTAGRGEMFVFTRGSVVVVSRYTGRKHWAGRRSTLGGSGAMSEWTYAAGPAGAG